MSHPPLIKTRIEAGIAELRLNRPQAMNALSYALVEELSQELDLMKQRDDIRVLLIRGEGRAFCAGGDLKFFREKVQARDAPGFRRFLELCRDTFLKIEKFPCPTIAVVNGVTVAGGLELLLACDLAIAAESAKIGDGHARYGIVPGGGAAIRLPRKIPVSIAKYLLFTGGLFPARQWLEWGLVSDVVPDDALDERVAQVCAAILRHSPLSMAVTKRLVNDGLEQPLSTALDSELLAWDAYTLSEDVLEGLSAFSEKREPAFSGR